MNYDSFKERINTIKYSVAQVEAKIIGEFIGPVATLEDINRIELIIEQELPSSFKKVLLEFSSNFSFKWFLHEDMKLPTEFRNIFSGRIHWDLHSLPQLKEEIEDWSDCIYPDEADEDDLIWDNKLAFCSVGNGDYLAFDLTDEVDAPVIYLNHEKGAGHGYKLADNFVELLENWSRLAFVGEEDDQWLPFTKDSASGLIPEGEPAKRFRAWLKINM